MRLRTTSKGDKLPSDWGFRLMTFAFKVRDILRLRQLILSETGIKPGYQVLDFGCGPGSYTAAASEMVGKQGKVYALDAHPLAIKTVDNLISRKHLSNVKTIFSECSTGLSENSVDVVLLYDTLHDLGDPKSVLIEISRALKPGGILSVSDHHLKQEEIASKVTENGLFKVSGKGKRTYSFVKR